MKPIIFARVADMKYYRGITEHDKPYGGGSYVNDTGMAHECYNFAPVEDAGDGKEFCLGFVMFNGAGGLNGQIHIEKLNGCEAMKNEERIDGAIVVFCAASPGSKTMRVVGFYKNATIFRHVQELEFDTVEDDGGYCQNYSFLADKKDCVLLPYTERHSNSKWYVPTNGRRGATFGFGRSNIWLASNTYINSELRTYVEQMIESIETYDGENWIDKEVM